MISLGLVTYNIAKDWTLDTLLAKCAALGYTGVELRTTHAHGVEVGLSAAARAEVRRRFADSPVTLVGLGSTFDYHAPEAAALARTLEASKAYVQLAADVGARGVKVRPNAFPPDVPRERTLEQIGRALREIGAFAADRGVRIRLEVHGRDTCHPPHIRRMLDLADHPNVYACWNSNHPGDLDATGSIDAHFALLRDKIDTVHINILHGPYPYRRLLALLREAGYRGFCLAEIPASADPDTVLAYYRRLFEEYWGQPCI